MGEHHDVAQYMIEQGALSITGIQDIAATKIQVSIRQNLIEHQWNEPVFRQHELQVYVVLCLPVWEIAREDERPAYEGM